VSEKQVTAEKATLLTVAIGALSSGVMFISQGNYVTGLILVAVGVLLIVLREYLKFILWRGEPVIPKSGDHLAISITGVRGVG